MYVNIRKFVVLPQTSNTVTIIIKNVLCFCLCRVIKLPAVEKAVKRGRGGAARGGRGGVSTRGRGLVKSNPNLLEDAPDILLEKEEGEEEKPVKKEVQQTAKRGKSFRGGGSTRKMPLVKECSVRLSDGEGKKTKGKTLKKKASETSEESIEEIEEDKVTKKKPIKKNNKKNTDDEVIDLDEENVDETTKKEEKDETNLVDIKGENDDKKVVKNTEDKKEQDNKVDSTEEKNGTKFVKSEETGKCDKNGEGCDLEKLLFDKESDSDKEERKKILEESHEVRNLELEFNDIMKEKINIEVTNTEEKIKRLKEMIRLLKGSPKKSETESKPEEGEEKKDKDKEPEKEKENSQEDEVTPENSGEGIKSEEFVNKEVDPKTAEGQQEVTREESNDAKEEKAKTEDNIDAKEEQAKQENKDKKEEAQYEVSGEKGGEKFVNSEVDPKTEETKDEVMPAGNTDDKKEEEQSEVSGKKSAEILVNDEERQEH